MDTAYKNQSPAFPSKGSAVIAGGGIVGLMSAYYLVQDGWTVTVLDKGDFTDNCSHGNAGMIVPSHFTPLAAPGVVAQGIKWMFDSRSPFYVKPALSRSLAFWGIRFLKHANQRHVNRSAPHILALNQQSKELYTELSDDLEQSFGLAHRGILMLFKSEKTAEEEALLAKQAADLGLVDVAMLNADEVQRLEPDVRLDVLGATHYRCDSHLNPHALMERVKAKLQQQGVKLVSHSAVTGFLKNNGRISVAQTANGEYPADLFILAAGAWLPSIAKLAGLRVPLMPGKGYSFQTTSFEDKLRHPALLLEARVAVTPMVNAVRIGGTMELASINHKINKNRLEGIVRAVPEYYPEHSIPLPSVKETWHGFRPCSPDGLPYLGRAKGTVNLIVAGGMGMMGLSLGPVAGKIVSQIAKGENMQTDIRLFDPLRFH